MSDFQRKSSTENYKRESAPRWPEETLQRHPQNLSEGFRHTNGVLTMSDQSGRGLSTKEQLSMTLCLEKRESVKKESTEKAKPIPMGQQLIP